MTRAFTEAQDGAIEGKVSPAESTPAVYAIADGDTVGTAYFNEMGEFLIRAVPAGNYTVTFEPKTGLASTQRENVEVQTGVVTDLEVITISEE